MLSAFVSTPAPKDPLSVLEVGERPEPEAAEGWTTIEVRAVSLNHHDLFSLRGIGLPAEKMPMILGTDAAGVDQ
ncbi:MAG: Zn-dependent oxidoreductase, NADPH:quinone reductase, partial [Blastococcus sp.]|nr:Zn-dependent oxidoreductase, NADPH:quinone reductase [Blastococcus sp.]